MENPGSLLRVLPHAQEILLACGVRLRDASADASDYEFFRAFCRAQDKLSNNRLTAFAKALLARNGCKEELSGENVDAIWRCFADLDEIALPDETQLIKEPIAVFPEQTLAPSEFVRMDQLVKKAQSAKTVDAFLASLLDAFESAKGQGVLIDLPEHCYGRQPSLYAVSQALESAEDPAVLRLQAIRLFAEKKIPMLVFPHESGAAALSFFARLETLVGPAKLFLIVTKENLALSLEFLFPRGGSAYPALSKERLSELAPSLFYEYPVGNSYLLLQELCRKSCKNH